LRCLDGTLRRLSETRRQQSGYHLPQKKFVLSFSNEAVRRLSEGDLHEPIIKERLA
jgi:hypothetical protein